VESRSYASALFHWLSDADYDPRLNMCINYRLDVGERKRYLKIQGIMGGSGSDLAMIGIIVVFLMSLETDDQHLVRHGGSLIVKSATAQEVESYVQAYIAKAKR
jgi:hypothetical protein